MSYELHHSVKFVSYLNRTVIDNMLSLSACICNVTLSMSRLYMIRMAPEIRMGALVENNDELIHQ